MRLTKREKLLMFIMLIAVVGGLMYYFVYVPQLEQISELKLTIKETELEISRVE
ncbi:MAG: hypothetical protein ACLKAO_01665 [Alkaliphilus sp.]